jgi:glycosyltransferase involved in cell wall biosynthesis
VRFLLLNQTFHPDVMATGQYLTQVALELVARGHQVTVVTSRRAYDDPSRSFLAREKWRGVDIHRVGSTGFGKGAKWKRAADFGSNQLACLAKVLTLPRHDAVLALTSPPLISVLGAAVARRWGARFFYWVMDFNPDEAVAAGWLRAGSAAFRVLDWMSRYSLRHATRVIALDRFMRDRITAKGIAPERVAVVPMWSHDADVRFDAVGRERFRAEHGLTGKFVVMYSGNHSPVHPLDTLIEAAVQLREDQNFAFLFIGGGSEFSRVQQIAVERGLTNILCLPYRPLKELSASLSAADAGVVVMGDAFVGLIHPCKIYNLLAAAAPVLYLGPTPSHVTELLPRLAPATPRAEVRHGDPDGLVRALQQMRHARPLDAARVPEPLTAEFAQARLLPRFCDLLEHAQASSVRAASEEV